MPPASSSARDLLPRWLIDDADLSPPPTDVTLLPWADGFTPSGCNGRSGRIVVNQPRATPGAFRVVDAAVDAHTADLLYASAVRAKVWGVYVPTRELMLRSARVSPQVLSERRQQLATQADEDLGDRQTQAAYRQRLSRQAVDEFLVAQGREIITEDDWSRIHGVAVWVIASDCDDETEYHLDYAEMLRYETNVIFPPVYGATLHVSPLRNPTPTEGHCESESSPRTSTNAPTDRLDGGGFFVNRRGLEHYREYGYKTRLANKVTTDALEARSRTESGWAHVPYAYRRGILCDGEYPHFSSRVRALPVGTKRVVVGFNLFPHAIGAFVERFPEHSEAFNRYVKLSQTAVRQAMTGGGADGPEAPRRWDLASLKQNPRQAAFIKYLARKVREKAAMETTTTVASIKSVSGSKDEQVRIRAAALTS